MAALGECRIIFEFLRKQAVATDHRCNRKGRFQ